MSDVSLIYCTCGSPEEAARLGRTLVEERLAACANVVEGVRSIYRWEGAVQDSVEALLIAKTGGAQAGAAIARLESLHSYDCPAILELPVGAGSAPFLAWVAAETTP